VETTEWGAGEKKIYGLDRVARCEVVDPSSYKEAQQRNEEKKMAYHDKTKTRQYKASKRGNRLFQTQIPEEEIHARQPHATRKGCARREIREQGSRRDETP